jgi:hypothetical protein
MRSVQQLAWSSSVEAGNWHPGDGCDDTAPEQLLPANTHQGHSRLELFAILPMGFFLFPRLTPSLKYISNLIEDE